MEAGDGGGAAAKSAKSMVYRLAIAGLLADMGLIYQNPRPRQAPEMAVVRPQVI